MEIISLRRTVHQTTYGHSFRWADEPLGGFFFPCDRDGEVMGLTDYARANYQECLTGTVDGKKILDKGIETYTSSYPEPAVGRCECGQEVHLSCFTNTCDCGRDYNMSGQLLAPREFWGEGTSESLSDILRIP